MKSKIVISKFDLKLAISARSCSALERYWKVANDWEEMKRCSAAVVDGGRAAGGLSLPLPLSTYFFEITLHADPALPLDAFTPPLSSPYRSWRPIV